MSDPDPVGIVKRQLWRNGIKAKDVSGSGLPFDLIVNGVHKVAVVVAGEELHAPRGVILAVVRDDTVEYQKCRGGTCVPAGALTKLFA